ncbi:MAG: M14 family metallopeptidase [Patescibacteria group bacterium]
MFTYPTSLFLMAGMLLAFTKDTPPAPAAVAEVEPQPIVETVFGYSETGREITGYELGRGDECLLFFGGIHGNERGTVELMQLFVDELKADPKLIPADKTLVVIPTLNPDGFLDREDKLNANEVNLNRNFATDDWIKQEGEEETFAGVAPFSEQESRVLREVVNDCDPSIMIAYHSQGALVSPEFNRESMALAVWYSVHSGYEYYDEWNYAGTATRWFVETSEKAAITVELTNHVDSDWELNKAALLEIIAR